MDTHELAKYLLSKPEASFHNDATSDNTRWTDVVYANGQEFRVGIFPVTGGHRTLEEAIIAGAARFDED